MYNIPEMTWVPITSTLITCIMYYYCPYIKMLTYPVAFSKISKKN